MIALRKMKNKKLKKKNPADKKKKDFFNKVYEVTKRFHTEKLLLMDILLKFAELNLLLELLAGL